ncbi:DUF58 domain-containing protein [Oceanobacter mangrovi]|uniref:DUF58 domain-containing protein n=1 Tax=Oceanobacter mangrovi TaxID=2862510 RepID=UPI001C8D751E|nr:DUF58 domain-containing protein [Oceanobacter mangrovi]
MSNVQDSRLPQVFGFELFQHGPKLDVSKLIGLGQLAARLPLRKQQRRLAANAGGHTSSIRGRGLDYAENRQYQPGDDIRAMDWRVTARTGQPHIKVYQEERERPVLLVGDFRSSMNFGTRRTLKQLVAAEVLALLGWAAIHEGDRLGCLLFNDQQELDLRPRPGHKQMLQLIHSLADFSPCQQPGETQKAEQKSAQKAAQKQQHEQQPLTANQRLLDICMHLKRVAKPGSSIYIVSDWHGMDSQVEARLAPLRRHCDLTAIQISDPLEAELPDLGWMALTDGQQRRHLRTDSSQRQLYQQAWQHKQQLLEEHLNRLAMPLIQLATPEHPLEVLRNGMGLNSGQKKSASRRSKA